MALSLHPRRRYEFLPEVLLAAGLAYFFVDEPDAALSAFESGRALLLMLVAAVVWLTARLALARLVPWPSARAAIFGIAAVGVLAVVVLPAYDDHTVIEAFPASAPAATPPTPPTTTPAKTNPATTAPATETTATTPDETHTTPPVDTTPTTTGPPTPPTSGAPAAPVLLRTGTFAGIDHRAAGTVTIYRAPDGRHVVGLEDFDVQPGPDYDVYIVPGGDRTDRDGGTRLDDLRGNRGTQYYDVPSDVSVDAGDWTILIWCQTFGVPVANATPV